MRGAWFEKNVFSRTFRIIGYIVFCLILDFFAGESVQVSILRGGNTTIMSVNGNTATLFSGVKLLQNYTQNPFTSKGESSTVKGVEKKNFGLKNQFWPWNSYVTIDLAYFFAI